MKHILFVCFFSMIARAEIFDISIPENDTASYNYADFRIWINDTTDTLKGVYWFMHANNGDSRNIVTDTTYQNLVTEQNFALVGAHIFTMHMSSGIGDAVIAAMDSFAVFSNHQEISFIPFFINGYSWGGQFAYHFTKWRPNRVAGFITQKGGYHDTTNAGIAIQVPALMIVAENDLDYRIENLTNIFFDHRDDGAKWILAMEPDANHSLVTDYPFLNTFFNKTVELRIPNNVDVYDTITLNSLSNSIGWLGDQETYTIGSWECYDGVIDSSSWFLSKTIGEHWQNFVYQFPADTSTCSPDLDSSYVFFKVGLHGTNDESDFMVTTNNQDLIDQCYGQLNLPVNERLLHINGFLNEGDGDFNSPWSWHIIPNEWALTEMSIGACNGTPFEVENDLNYWVNDIGQLCNWGSYIKNEIILDCNINEVSLWDSCYVIDSTTELDLSGIGLTGSIPQEIGELINLNYINLRYNDLTGSIPNSIGNLTNLSTLSLSDNSLSGELPIEIGGLVNLETLYLYNNQITGNLPDFFDDMSNLRYLGIFENKFNGVIPPSLCNIYSDLEYIGVYSNNFCPPYPSCLSQDELGPQDTTDCESLSINNNNIFSKFKLHSLYPNPFNPTTKIRYNLHGTSSVTISIYNINGKKIYSLSEKNKTRGFHTFKINGEKWVSGIYFVEFIVNQERKIKKVMLIK